MEEYVLKGVALLDSKLPGWEEHINWDELNIQDLARCVIGQLNRVLDVNMFTILGFERGYVEGRGYGFDVPNPAHDSYADLTQAWKEWHKHHRMHV
jgi:hypothetical protein